MASRQLDLYDLRGPDGKPLVPMPGAVTGTPQSVCSIVEQTGGSAASGHQRSVATDDVEESIWRFMVHATAMYGWPGAAKLLLHMVARDPYFAPYEWMVRLFKEHERELREQFSRDAGHGRDTDYSEGNSDE